jgi:hypothetical protein
MGVSSLAKEFTVNSVTTAAFDPPFDASRGKHNLTELCMAITARI